MMSSPRSYRPLGRCCFSQARLGRLAAASAWEQPPEASQPDECFPRSDASSAGDCLGDISITTAADSSLSLGHERARRTGHYSRDARGDMSMAAHVAVELGNRGAGAGMSEPLCICN
jgi:hypothetical protein